MVDNQYFRYNNHMQIRNSSISKELINDKAFTGMQDDQLVAFYSERYKDIDIADFLFHNRKERFYGLINLIQKGEFYLDVGCANGGHMEELFNREIQGIGLDISISNIIRGRERFPHLKFIHGFAEEIPFSDDFFDIVIIGDVLEHFRDPKAVFSECIRVARKAIVLCVPIDEMFTDEHISPFSFDLLEKFLKSFKLDYHYFSSSGEEISPSEVLANLSVFKWALIRAEITTETKDIILNYFKTNKIKLSNQDYIRILENDQWKKNPDIIRHESEIARFHLISHLIEGSNVLEMGCGNGDSVIEIIHNKLQAVGIDISSFGIYQARQKKIQNIRENDINFCIMDSFETAFKDNSFDTVIIPEVLEHIRSSRLVIQEAIRVVRHGGRIIISVPDGLLVPWEGHIRIFFRDTLDAELKQYSDHIEWHSLPFKKWLFCSFFVKKSGYCPIIEKPVDIIMATYNGHSTIQKAIQSVLDQTYPFWNLIIVNDGGDSLKQILNSINDSRIIYIETEHKGKSHALNVGISQSTSDYITYLDDDDLIYPLHLDILVNDLIISGSEFVFCNWYEVEVDHNGCEYKRYVEFNEEVTPNKLLFQNYINHKCILHSRNLIKNVGLYDENLLVWLDWDMIRRMAFYSSPHQIIAFTSEHIKYFNQNILQNRITSLWFTQESSVINNLKDSVKRIIQKDILKIKKNSEFKVIIGESLQYIYFRQFFPEIIKFYQLSNQVLERENTIEQLTNQVLERENTIEQLTNQVSERENTIEQLNMQLNLLNQTLFDKEQQLQNISNQVKDLEITIKKFYHIPLIGPLNLNCMELINTMQIQKDIRFLRKSIFFDPVWYKTHYPDVTDKDIDPAWHYASCGWSEGRDPGPNFSTIGYLLNNPDVKKSGINPLLHYEQYGRKEGRNPSYYREIQDKLPSDGVSSYVSARSPISNKEISKPQEDTNFVSNIKKIGVNLFRLPILGALFQKCLGLTLYLSIRKNAYIISKSEFYDPTWYLTCYPDVAASNLNPAWHYAKHGWIEGRDPGPDFSSNDYLSKYPDVRKTGVNPLLHYELFGRREGREHKKKNNSLQIEQNILNNIITFNTVSIKNSLESLPLPQDNKNSDHHSLWSYLPKISVILPVWNTNEKSLNQAIISVITQEYNNWELCIVDGGSNKHNIKDILSFYSDLDIRIKVKYLSTNRGISLNSNEAFFMASGDYITLLDHDDEFSSNAFFEVVKLLNIHPNLDVIYSDEDKISPEGKLIEPFYKPDFSLELLRNMNYLIHGIFLRKTLIHEVGLFNQHFDGAQDYDLFFRIVEKKPKIAHIPLILYHWRMSEQSGAQNALAKPYIYERGIEVIENHLKRMGIKADVSIGSGWGFYKVNYTINKYEYVDIIIPTRKLDLLKKCLKSLIHSTYKKYRIFTVINGNNDYKIIEIINFDLSEINRFVDSRTGLIGPEISYNWSRMNNLALFKTNSPYIITLNDDIEIITNDWIEKFLQYAQFQQIGAVGCMLLHKNNLIQHAGDYYTSEGLGNHMFNGMECDSFQIYGFAQIARDCSAVTSACMMIRRDVFYQVGFFDECLSDYDDLEFCSRLKKAGYSIIYSPYIRAYHLESPTRPQILDPGLIKDVKSKINITRDQFFREEWLDLIKKPE